MSSLETYQIYINCVKTYNVERLKRHNSYYDGDVEGIAAWFFHNYGNHHDNITIILHGGFHNTYPNVDHLTVEITSDNNTTGKLHMSIDKDGFWYQQKLGEVYPNETHYNKSGKVIPKRKSTKRKSTKRKSTKRKSTKRKSAKI